MFFINFSPLVSLVLGCLHSQIKGLVLSSDQISKVTTQPSLKLGIFKLVDFYRLLTLQYLLVMERYSLENQDTLAPSLLPIYLYVTERAGEKTEYNSTLALKKIVTD